MTANEELRKKLREKEPPIEIWKTFEYNGIKVQISNKDSVMIQPKGKNFWLEDSKKNIKNCVDKMSENILLEGIPKKVWVDWLEKSEKIGEVDWDALRKEVEEERKKRG